MIKSWFGDLGHSVSKLILVLLYYLLTLDKLICDSKPSSYSPRQHYF